MRRHTVVGIIAAFNGSVEIGSHTGKGLTDHTCSKCIGRLSVTDSQDNVRTGVAGIHNIGSSRNAADHNSIGIFFLFIRNRQSNFHVVREASDHIIRPACDAADTYFKRIIAPVPFDMNHAVNDTQILDHASRHIPGILSVRRNRVSSALRVHEIITSPGFGKQSRILVISLDAQAADDITVTVENTVESVVGIDSFSCPNRHKSAFEDAAFPVIRFRQNDIVHENIIPVQVIPHVVKVFRRVDSRVSIGYFRQSCNTVFLQKQHIQVFPYCRTCRIDHDRRAHQHRTRRNHAHPSGQWFSLFHHRSLLLFQ